MKKILVIPLLILGLSISGLIQGQVNPIKTSAYPVTINKDTIFYIHQGFGPFSTEERAHAITSRLKALVEEYRFDEDSMTIAPIESDFYIIYKGQIMMVVSQKDTTGTGQTQQQLATNLQDLLKEEIVSHRRFINVRSLIKNIILTAVIIVVVLVIIKLLSILFRKIHNWIEKNKSRIFRSITFRNFEFMTVEREYVLARGFLRIARIAMIIITILIAFPIIFSLFPATESITRKIIGMIWSPFRGILVSIWEYLPNLISIALVIIVFRYLIRFIGYLAKEVERGSLVIPGFYTDWALPTFKIIKFILYIFMFIIIFPYLPGSDSPIFRGVSVFLGLLISLGSTTAVGNTVAGLVITYMRPFKKGDRIKIDDITGDVVEKTLLITRLRTIKNEEITIPNSKILTGYTVNYSAPTEDIGLIIHTTVTIGYNAPWRKVHELLISAANATNGVAKEPVPFVLQTSLDDFFISYQINAYIKSARAIATIKSELHQNIQDEFARAGIEIMSPHYRSERDGNPSTVPSLPHEKQDMEPAD